MKRICVFCGSSPGAQPEYAHVSEQLGQALVDRGIGLVYGGGGVGLMGKIARSVLGAGGEVIGVIPMAIADQELALKELSDLRIVGSMHERKALMAELSDGFIAAPGGLGTLEEIFEVLTWAQLGFHDKPCGLLNVGGYYDALLAFLESAVDEEFVRPVDRSLLLVGEEPDELLDRFERYEPPAFDKVEWILSMNET